MPRYRYDGHDERVLMGLAHGVNAQLHRDEHGQPDGSTVVIQPGDELTTVEAYEHALLTELDPDARPKKPRAPRAAKAPTDSTPETTDPEGEE